MAELSIGEENTTMNPDMSSSTTLAGLSSTMGWPRVLALIVGLALALMALGARAQDASAKSEIFGFDTVPSTSQAGGHPDIFTQFQLGTRANQEKVPCECNDPKDVYQHMPAGVIANPHVVSECHIAELVLFKCPADSQAGVVVLQLFGYVVVPLYRTVPQKGQAGLFVFSLPLGQAVPQYIAFNARTESDYGLDAESTGISHVLPLLFYGPVFWGVPGAHINDPMRFAPGENAFECSSNPFAAMESRDPEALGAVCPGIVNKSVPSSLPIAPMLQNPTTCSGPLVASMESVAYDKGTDTATTPWPATTGCDSLSFDPSLAASPTTTNADSPTGLEVVMKVPQYQDPNVPSPSELRANTVTLPPGFSINPNAADGKTSCTDAQSAVGTRNEASCPEESKVGTVTIDSSALPAPIHGFIYLGEPKPGERYRLVLTANGFGTAVKLLGTVHADPVTGQLKTTFENLPETPFQEFVLHFFGSERGMLATPTQCGKYPVTTKFVPWAGELSVQEQTQFFVLDHGPNGTPCPGPIRTFSPELYAGGRDNTAGAHSPFALRVTREDGQQDVTGISVKMPPGLVATLRGVPYCPEAAIASLTVSSHSGRDEFAAPACPAASRVGSVTAGVGAGSHPFYGPGTAYLAGPYRGAPVSMIIVVPAVSGPYDLGNIAVRVPFYVDPVTAEITAVSDPLPQILGGIPLRARSLQLQIDRPGFTLNPTNCNPFAVGATVTGDQGASVALSTPFQVANCRQLAYAPKLKLKLGGGVARLGHPSVKAVFRTKPGEANTKRVTVSLPPGELLDQAHIDTVCRRPEFATNTCPAGSRLGWARVSTPLLDRPLQGRVYLRANPKGLPDIAMDLEGQIDFQVAGRIGTSREGALRTTFSAPDAPVSSLVVHFAGGKKGLIRNSSNLCGARKKAKAKLLGQNGRTAKRKIPLQVSCGKHKHKRKHHSRRAGR